MRVDAMKALLITSGSVVSFIAVLLFLNCPRVVCSSPGGYFNWVRYEVNAASDLIFGNEGY